MSSNEDFKLSFDPVWIKTHTGSKDITKMSIQYQGPFIMTWTEVQQFLEELDELDELDVDHLMKMEWGISRLHL